MNVSTITKLAAKMMGDAGGSVWAPAVMVDYVKPAVNRLLDDRPDLLLATTGLIAQDTIVEALTSTSELPDSITGSHSLALSHMVCHLCYIEDADETANEKLAAGHLALYEKAVS